MNKENSKIEKLLENLGLEEKEAKVYLALLNNGPMLPQHIARSAGIKRTTLYSLFPEMTERGIIKEITQGKRRLLSANSPDDLFKEYEEKYKEIKNNITELATIYRMQGLKPKIQIYEGLEGVKKCYADSLNAIKSISYYQQFLNYHSQIRKWILGEYVKRRISRNIFSYAIVPEESKEFHSNAKEFMREARYIPLKKFHFTIGTLIYNDKVSFISCGKGQPLVGIIIESKPIAETQKALFDLAWEGAANYQR